MKTKLFFLLLFSISFQFTSGQVYNWKNYTDMKTIRSAEYSGDQIWAATAGGTFSYNISDATYNKFHKVDGLSGSSLTSLAIDNTGRIWLGSSTGHLDVYDPGTGFFKAILDIFNSLKLPKGINDIFISGDSVFIAADFGVSVINQSTFVFVDTYSRFGNLRSNLRVNDIFKGNLIYAALDEAVAIQKPGAINLSSPDSWNIYNISFNNSQKIVRQVIEYNGQIIAGTNGGLFFLQDSAFIPYLDILNGSNVNLLKVIDNVLYIAASTDLNKLFKFDGQLTEIYQGSRVVSSVFSTPLGIFAGTNDGIIPISVEQQSASVIKPNAPNANLFSSLSVDENGNVWATSGSDATGGFYQLSNGEWDNFDISNPLIPTNTYFNSYTIKDETYLGSWGFGFLKLKGDQIVNFDVTNTPINGTADFPDYLVIGGLAKDSKDNLWVLNYQSVSKEYLNMLTPDSTWYNFKIPAMQDQLVVNNFGLVIDRQNTKWWYSRSENRPGLFFFNENNTPGDAVDDLSGYITNLNDKVSSLAIDNRGDLWIGTALGVNVINNPAAAASANPQFQPSSVFSLRQYSINCIAVDPLNRKWIGTNQGLILVNSDGSALISSFDTRNSALLSDEIRSLAIDKKTGVVYAGTDAGLTSFETLAKMPSDTFSDLLIYPNPLKLNDSKEVTVTIDGLIRDTDIKIINVSGRIVNQFSSPGGRVALWDGKNNEGELVNSGIYIIIASDKEGNNVQSAKIAVLKE